MATSVISGRIEAPDGTPLANCTVTCVLRPRPAFRITDGVELAKSLSTSTDANGDYSFDLERTANIYPAESTYKITEFIPDQYGGPAQHRIQVGDVAQTVYASIVSTPPATDPTETYLTQAAGDARYSQGTPTFGDAAFVSESRPADTVSAGVQGVYARVDHRHDREIISGTAADRAALTGTDLVEGLRFRETDGNDLIYERRAGAWVQKSDVVICANDAAVLAITTPYTGMQAWNVALSHLLVYNGTAWVTITPMNDMVSIEEPETSTTYDDLATPGPSVSMRTGTKAFLSWSALFYQVGGGTGSISVAVSGATTVAASDNYRLFSPTTSYGMGSTFQFIITGLTPGVNVFTMKYRTTSNTMQCGARSLTVVGVP